MKQQTVTASPTPKIMIEPVKGDLRLAGWDRSEIMVKTDGEDLQISAQTDPIVISCDEDLIVYMPRGATVNVEKVSGDASLQALNGPVTLGPVAGDLTMNDLGPVTLATVAGDASLRNIGALSAETISGDFALRVGHGTCAIDTIGGDASFRDIDGMLTVENVGSDLYVRNVYGGVTVKAGADVAFYITPKPGQLYDVTAGDDIIARLPPDAKVILHLTANSPDSIQVDFPGVEIPEDCKSCEVTIGERTEGMAEMLLTAANDLLVTSQADPWESAAAFDAGNWRIPIPPIPPLPPDFSERINRRVQASLERAQVHIDAASRRTEAKVQAAMRRAEMKARAAEVRGRRGGHLNINVGRWNWDMTPQGPTEPGEAVSDEERLVILRMLQEKKISLEEAEKLLAALEGK